VITTATRTNVLSVPIQATTIRETIIDEEGNLVREEPPAAGRGLPRPVVTSPPELAPGQTRKELEGVFVVRSGQALFTPVRTGIAGEKHFEVVHGLAEGDQVITGPFASVRSLRDYDAVEVTTAPSGSSAVGK
jgi:HlyD family secretion protein